MAKYREFRRPSINLDPVGRTWGIRRTKDLKPGDVVPDFGQVVEVSPSAPEAGPVFVGFSSGHAALLTENVFCFSEGEVIGNS